MSEQPSRRRAAPDSNRDRAGKPAWLWPLWIWLVIAAVTSVLGTPADPYSMLVALAYGLVCFWVGVVLATGSWLVLRIVPLVLFVAAALWVATVAEWDLHLGVIFLYGVVSIACGVWCYLTIHDRPLCTLTGFSLGYGLGIIAGPPGSILSASLGVWLARRLCRKREPVKQRPYDMV